MQERVGVRDDPERGRPGAEEALDVDPGGRHPQPVPLVLEEERVGRVAVERGREVEEGEADVVDLAAVHLRRVGVPELVDRADDAEEAEELEDVDQRLLEKRIELVGSRPDRLPVEDENADRPCHDDRPEDDERRGPEPADVADGAVRGSGPGRRRGTA